GDPEGELPPRRLLDVLEVHEDGLRRLWPEPRDGRGVLDRTDERLEHEVELTRVGKLALAAVRAGHAGEVELLRAPRGRELLTLGQVVEPETLAAVPALDQRVGEILHVSRRFPHARVHEDRTVQTVCGRDVAVKDVPKKAAEVPVELRRQRRVETQPGRRFEVTHQEVPKRLQPANRERRHVREPDRAARADRTARGWLPRIRFLDQSLPALRAFAELGPKPGAVEEMEVEPPADRRRIHPRVERAKGC